LLAACSQRHIFVIILSDFAKHFQPADLRCLAGKFDVLRIDIILRLCYINVKPRAPAAPGETAFWRRGGQCRAFMAANNLKG
jgi:hypothetical protein